MKKYRLAGICFTLCLSLMTISNVHAESIVTDDGLYSFDRSKKSIMAYNPNNVADAPKVVTIPEKVSVAGMEYNVLQIQLGAFNASDKVTKIVVPDSVTQISSGAFDSCPDLEEIILGKGIEKINGLIGNDLPSLKSFTVPGTVKTLAGMPFEYCGNLAEMIFEEGFESITGADIDQEDSLIGLKRIVLPSTMKEINANAFANSSALTDIVIAQSKDTSVIAAGEPWGAKGATVTWSGGSSTSIASSSDVKVYYDPSNKISDSSNPAVAQWSVVIPKAIHFSEEPNGKKMEANVTLKSENGSVLPSGSSAVKVSVASDNGYLLKYNAENVLYELTYADELGNQGILNKDSGTSKMMIGTLQDGKTTITSIAEVKGIASAIGIYSDTLTYTVEKVTLP